MKNNLRVATSFLSVAGERTDPQRPPWSLPNELFTRVCTGCGECVAECPRSLLLTGTDGLPHLDFEQGGCDFCGECVNACGPGALSKRFQGVARPAWTLQAHIGASCLAHRGLLCRLCADACATRAIRFQIEPELYALPVVATALCTGCGECYRRCPPRAIKLRSTGE